MTTHYSEIAFTPAVKAQQELNGSRKGYTAREAAMPAAPDLLGPEETAFIATQDSFYMASTSETGWPYIQHRGGPAGFIRVLSDHQLGFADFRGNRNISASAIFPPTTGWRCSSWTMRTRPGSNCWGAPAPSI